VVRRRKPQVDDFLDAVVRDRRPPRFPAEEEDVRVMLTAAALRAGQPGADSPHPDFVEKLERRLRTAMEAGEGSGSRRVSRRRLIGGAAAAAAAAVGVGAGIDRIIDRAGEQAALAPPRELVPQAGRWIDVGSLDEVPVGRPLRFSAGAVEGFVVNHGEGRVQAVSAMCTHMPCTLVLNAAAQRLDCPCHRAWFGLDGRPLASDYPYRLPALPTVRTRVVSGRVEVLSA
jgi:cytochrome b6-f complex iron-sulfur subunit